MKVSDIQLAEMLTFAPEEGMLRLGSDRMLIFRFDSLALLRSLLFEQVGEALARSVLSQFGYRWGAGDYETLTRLYEWDSEQDKISAGPVMHMWEGIVHVQPTMLDYDRPSGRFRMAGIWKNSYEAEAHLRDLGRSTTPVCYTLTGYASGYATAFFGRPLLAVETSCVGRGDAHCGFEIRPQGDWDERAEPYRAALEASSFSLVRELEQKVALVEQQASAIRDLSTPVLEVWDDVLVLPIVGVVDTRRSVEIMGNLLGAIVRTKAKCVIVDVTGVEVVDTRTADYFVKICRAASLLGSRSVLTGLSPGVAQTLVSVGADLREIVTLRSLREGLKDCLRYLRES